MELHGVAAEVGVDFFREIGSFRNMPTELPPERIYPTAQNNGSVVNSSRVQLRTQAWLGNQEQFFSHQTELMHCNPWRYRDYLH
jgi:hypothetical protein